MTTELETSIKPYMYINSSHSNNNLPDQSSLKQYFSVNSNSLPVRKKRTDQNYSEETSVDRDAAKNVDPNGIDAINGQGVKERIYPKAEITDRDVQLKKADGSTDDFYRAFSLPEDALVSNFEDPVCYCFDFEETGSLHSVATSTLSGCCRKFYDSSNFNKYFKPIIKTSSLPPAEFLYAGQIDLLQVGYKSIDNVMKNLANLEIVRKSEASMTQHQGTDNRGVKSIDATTHLKDIQRLSDMDPHSKQQPLQYYDKVVDYQNRSSDSSREHLRPTTPPTVSAIASKLLNYSNLKNKTSVGKIRCITPNTHVPAHKLMSELGIMPFSHGYDNASSDNFKLCAYSGNYENQGVNTDNLYRNWYVDRSQISTPVEDMPIPLNCATPSLSRWIYSEVSSHEQHIRQRNPVQFMRPQIPLQSNSMFPNARSFEERNKMAQSYAQSNSELHSMRSNAYKLNYPELPNKD